jgi:hypothetical protein
MALDPPVEMTFDDIPDLNAVVKSDTTELFSLSTDEEEVVQ